MGWALMMMYCIQETSSYVSSMALIPVAEEITFKCSHGQGGNFQLTWCEQIILYLHLPIKSIFVSWVNNLLLPFLENKAG